MDKHNSFSQNISHTDTQDKLLNIIETIIKQEETYLQEKLKLIITKITQLYSLETIKHLLKQIITNKQIFFIRHAEAEHNAYNKQIRNLNINVTVKKTFHNPGLTELGLSQSKLLSEELITYPITFDLVFVSPLKRTIETFCCIKDSLLTKQNKVNFIATEFLREALTINNKNIGHDKTKLIEYVNNKQCGLNCEFISKDKWWLNEMNDYFGDNMEHEPENKKLFKNRIRLFLLWIMLKNESNILIISHSKVFKFITKTKIKNGEIKQLDKDKVLKKCINIFTKALL